MMRGTTKNLMVSWQPLDRRTTVWVAKVFDFPANLLYFTMTNSPPCTAAISNELFYNDQQPTLHSSNFK
eukprot:SAG11_NODE_326_length_10708_cov_6.937035_1_plen_69_part_00